MSQPVSYTRAVVHATATNVILAALGLTTGIIAARLLGVEGRGELAAIQLWPTVIAVVAPLGLAEALVFRVARDSQRAQSYFGTALAIALFASIALMFAGYALIPVVLNQQSTDVITYSRYYLLVVPLSVTLSLVFSLLRGKGQFREWNVMRVAPSLGWLAILTIAWWLSAATAPFVAMGYVIVLCLAVIPICVVVGRLLGRGIAFGRALSGPMLQTGFPTFLATLFQQIQTRFDHIVLAALVEPKLLGFYAVAASWASAAMPLFSAVGAITGPRVAGAQASHSSAQILASTVRASVLLALVLGVVGSLATPWVLPLLFGSAFIEATGPASLLFWSATLFGVNYVIAEGLRGIDKARDVLVAETVGSVTTVVFVIGLLPRFGLIGAASAAVLGALSSSVVLIWRVSNATELSFARTCVPTRSDIKAIFSYVRSR